MVNIVPDVTYHFCLALPAAFTQPGMGTTFEPSPVESPTSTDNGEYDMRVRREVRGGLLPRNGWPCILEPNEQADGWGLPNNVGAF